MADYLAKIQQRVEAFKKDDAVRRIWAADPFVWTGADEDRWLGWLNLPMHALDSAAELADFGASLAREGVTDAVLLGMGGSSLAPEVMRAILGVRTGQPNLHVLDSTDPDQILAVERKIDYARTIFLVASKSGSTLEVNILKQYFFEGTVKRLGESKAGDRFVLTTDPSSKLEQIARQERFRKIFPGIPSVGGRYSALSNFGLVPAAAIGVDLPKFIERAEAMARRCASSDDNPGLELGATLGVLALEGRDKPTLVAPAQLAPFGAWLEQLVAESLGKHGKGIIPIAGEELGGPEVYGQDRVFVQLRLKSAPDAGADERVNALERAGHPLVRIDWNDTYDLAGEFFRWEFATAIMGAVIGVNPFDQPDVEESKIVTRRLAAEYEKTGKFPPESAQARPQQPEAVAGLLAQLKPGDYFALQAFIQMSPENERALERIRMIVRDRKRVATTVGFGPRFLHSTGQAHKGGPNSGVFLQITADDKEDIQVPGQKYTFGTIKTAQARGDAEVLASRGRRMMRVHLNDATTGLNDLYDAVRKALV